jgi:plastocyanin
MVRRDVSGRCPGHAPGRRPIARIARPLALIVTAAVFLPGLAQGQEPPTTASVVALDEPNRFEAAGGGTNVTLATGGIVTFSYPSGRSRHNVHFNGALQPQSCTRTAGTPSGSVPPTGVYAFDGGVRQRRGERARARPAGGRCELHPTMVGTVTVADAVTPAPQPATPAPGPPTGGGGPAGGSLRLAARQRGSVVTGSVLVNRAGSRIDVRALARRALVGSATKAGRARVGRYLRLSVGGGRVAFRVPLNAAARRALRRTGELPLIVQVIVTPPEGRSFATRRAVKLRRGTTGRIGVR